MDSDEGQRKSYRFLAQFDNFLIPSTTFGAYFSIILSSIVLPIIEALRNSSPLKSIKHSLVSIFFELKPKSEAGNIATPVSSKIVAISCGWTPSMVKDNTPPRSLGFPINLT